MLAARRTLVLQQLLLAPSFALQQQQHKSTDADGHAATPKAPVQLIIDTDMSSDVDDVAAVCAAHALADRGEAELAAACYAKILSTGMVPTKAERDQLATRAAEAQQLVDAQADASLLASVVGSLEVRDYALFGES